MDVKRSIATLVAGMLVAACLMVFLAPPYIGLAGRATPGTSDLQLPVFPGASLDTRLPADGEPRYLSFRTPAAPEEIRRYFAEGGHQNGWVFTGQVAGTAGVVLQDRNGRRLIIDVRAMSSCLLRCQQQIHYWLAAR